MSVETASYINACLMKVLELKGQDLFLKVGSVPRTRVGGKVVAMPFPPLKDEDSKDILKALLSPSQYALLEKNRSVDFAFSTLGAGDRFRGNAFCQQGTYSVVIRTLWKNIPTFEELRLPPILKKVALEKSGIILIAGAVSSGKTTTISAMIELMNENVERHILTIEDPVEYLYQDKKCVINQREIGPDALDFSSALRYVVRQSPDVIVIGEMRDAETFQFAVTAAEIGRLVISTVHAKSVVQIFDRVMGFFPAQERDQALSYLAYNINCLAVQKLLVAKDGKRLVPAFEIMVGNYTLRQLLREKKFEKIPQAIRNNANEGMCTMDDSLLKLWKEGAISAEAAFAASEKPQELENIMKGIRIDGQSGKILGT